ncbi:cell shape-determining protein MreD [Wenyingzhuangia heitensis]|uniref:Cell shape-determining protein MreD n=1 Tax=Wenyingzhuangia heitensis TaxID=1487859 RepID=A0ABX0UAL4_9FLAO|nr:rod shape-determining protein MreD [Wenyingzhuangia heitensis]NIJ45854.1 cell shape-determining protein MreD [Wenyingzhuangia heitensis]
MTSANIKILIRFLLLIPLQVLIANHMRLFGYINPQISLLFLLWYPLKKDVSGFLVNSFLFGLMIDLFSNSGGVNAAACLLLAYTRLPIIKFIFNDKEINLKLFKYSNYSTMPKIALIFSLAFIHQFTVYSLEYFNVSYILTILQKTFTNSLFTTFVVIIFLSIFTSTKKQ